MMDLRDIHGRVIAEDDRIVAYWQLVCASQRLAALRILSTRMASPALISVTLEACDQDDGLLCAAAANPNTPLTQLTSWVFGSHGERPAVTAARNPALGDQVPELHGLVPSRVAQHMLENPGAPAEFIERHWRTAPTHALRNPNCDPDILDECCGDGANAALLAAALENPKVPRRYLDSAVHHGDAMVRIASARHPRRTREELDLIEEVELGHAEPSDHVLSAVRASLARLIRRAAPFTAQVGKLHKLRYEPQIAAALFADGDVAAAARHLIAAGFDGTVAELLTVAETFQR